ncbi:hypothetical protein XacyCFBP2565_14910 [Xanthomonas arboricola pv. corylina]|uniref:hypothetical protein n=1 Tax=Xanthomonas arboricola TaxID=56448 RepID=UPI000CEE1588|nr:hypothetical protein [Xanthomonas arboricola]PPU13348.1 hypothetical protein XacyCFBP2565_14910 [Xanthomonas arboricola pv. corylina]
MDKRSRNPTILLLGMTLLTAILYWPGLNGPFLMDDQQHLLLVQSWHQGQIGFWDMAAGNGNWLLHRSLAMASLALNVAIGGDSSTSLKLGNLLGHLLCAWIAYVLFRRLLARDRNLAGHAGLIAALICSLWLLHPINVSTVLYVVQRMSEIAAIFPLLGVALYATIRNRMLAGRLKATQALVLLFLGIPLLTLLGIQGKQSAVVLIGLCLVVELGWFQEPRDWPWVLKSFYLVFVAVPLLALPLVLHHYWQPLEAAMLEWGMTPTERLLTEPRVLWQYLRMLVAPYSPAMGIYNDDIAISSSLLSPVSTLLSVAGLILISVVAWRVRKRLPATFVGWFWFLVAHSVEASIVPIELYYEHRNYLPQFGLWLMLIDLAAAALRHLDKSGMKVRMLGWTLAGGFIMVLSIQTWQRVMVWQTSLGISLTAIETHPNSARAHVAFGFAAMQAGLVGDTYRVFEQLAANSDPALAAIGKVELTVLNCHLKSDSDPELLLQAGRESTAFINPVLPYAISNLMEVHARKGCGRVTSAVLAETIEDVLARATGQREASQAKWSLRYNAALAHDQAGDWRDALNQTRIAWSRSPDPTIALFHVKLLLRAGDLNAAKAAFWDVMRRARYTSVSELEGASRGAALRAMLKEINTYAAEHGQQGLH